MRKPLVAPRVAFKFNVKRNAVDGVPYGFFPHPSLPSGKATFPKREGKAGKARPLPF
ncbi:MAG: hypothetical protein ACI4IW_01760 [Oscillospiraceae bacterium]